MIARRALGIAAVIGGGASLAVGVFSIWTAPLLVTEMMERRGIGAAVAGGLVTMELIALAIASFLVAPRVDRLDKRMLATAGAVLATAGFAVLAATTGIVVTAAALIVIGSGQGLAFAAASGIAAASDQPDRAYGEMTVVGGVYGAAWLFLAPRAEGLAPDASVAFVVATLLCIPPLLLCPSERRAGSAVTAGRVAFEPPAMMLMVAVVLLFSAAGA